MERDEEFKFPTIVSDVNYEVLVGLDDSSLFNFCATDKYAVEICRDDNFWRRRVNNKLALFIHLKRANETWREFYYRVQYNMYYVIVSIVGGDTSSSLFTNTEFLFERLYYRLNGAKIPSRLPAYKSNGVRSPQSRADYRSDESFITKENLQTMTKG